MLDEMTRIWTAASRGAAGSIGPAPGLERSHVVIGGHGSRAYARTAIFGKGWIAGSRGVEVFRRGADGVRQAWAEHGRDGAPWLMALPYFSLGPRARDNAEAFLTDHYAVEGPRVAQRIAAAVLTDADAVRAAVAVYEQAGCDELLLFPCSADPQQVRLLAEAIG